MALRSSSTNSKEKDEYYNQEVTVSPADDTEAQEESETVDGVFGDVKKEGAVDYRSLGWKTAAIFMTKSQIGIGVLSIPSSMQVLGVIPGSIILLFFAAVTTWSDVEIGVFKLNHPQVYSIGDCMQLIFGPVGQWIGDICYWLFCVFVGGSAFITLSTALNAISLHATCTAVFVAVATIVTGLVASLPRLTNIKFLGWAALTCILTALGIMLFAVPLGGRPSLAPQTGAYDLDVKLFNSPSFTAALSSIANIFWAFTGTCSFLPIASEMKNPKDFKKAVLLCQGVVTAVYLTVGVVVYVYAGQYVASPALGTAGVLLKRVSYGIALPGLLFTAVLFVHLPAKMAFVKILRGSKHLAEPTKTHYITWFGSVAACTLISYVIASGIPVFGGLVGLIGALFGTLLSLHAEAAMWMYDHRGWFKHPSSRTSKITAGMLGCFAILFFGSFLTVAGTYASIVDIINSFASGTSRSWTCADNSGSS